MDTIVYTCRFRKKHQEDRDRPYVITAYSVQDYQLIRVELGDLFWEEQAGGQTFRPPFWKKYAEKRYLKQVSENLKDKLFPLIDDRGENYRTGCLSERALRQQIVPLPEFACYLDQTWTNRLLPYARYTHFIVLGTVPYLPEMLCLLAKRMKSLLWILPDHYYAEMLENFAEDFYQEYGLAMELRFLMADETYGHVRLEERQLREPVSVLDFTEGKCVPRMNPGKAVWLDMASVEEKERRLTARGMNVDYFSLKKIWTGQSKAFLSLREPSQKSRPMPL